MNKQQRIRQEKGITLIALIITIVVLLILAVVTINSIQGDGIIRYAQNAADEYTEKANQEQTDLNTLLEQIEATQPITWTYADEDSSGNISIGDLVKASNNEEFYVIGGDTAGTPIISSTEKVLLLAKNNLKADGSAQDTTGKINPCTFCTETAWNGASVVVNDDLNTKATIKADTTSAVYKAMKYGETLGVTTGRLMIKSEAEDLNNDEYKDILYGRNGKSSGTYLNYWLGSVTDARGVWNVYGYDSRFGAGSTFANGGYFGVRPVVEILKSDIS